MPRININTEYSYDSHIEGECPYCGSIDTIIDKKGNVRCCGCNQILEFAPEEQPKHKIKKFKDEK